MVELITYELSIIVKKVSIYIKIINIRYKFTIPIQ